MFLQRRTYPSSIVFAAGMKMSRCLCHFTVLITCVKVASRNCCFCCMLLHRLTPRRGPWPGNPSPYVSQAQIKRFGHCCHKQMPHCTAGTCEVRARFVPPNLPSTSAVRDTETLSACSNRAFGFIGVTGANSMHYAMPIWYTMPVWRRKACSIWVLESAFANA